MLNALGVFKANSNYNEHNMSDRNIDAIVHYISERAGHLTEGNFGKIQGVCRTCKTQVLLVVPEAQQSMNSVQEDFDCPWCLQPGLALRQR